ncbi:MAG: PAS domain S-box protein [Chloroflexota bacterium]|nr:PAS domain S-box protein [Chloroflexota bacterium]
MSDKGKIRQTSTKQWQKEDKIERKPISSAASVAADANEQTDYEDHPHHKDIHLLYDFSAILDRSGIVQFATESPIEALGYSESDIIGKVFWDTRWFAKSVESQRRIKECALAASHGENNQCKTKVLTKDGKIIPVTFAVSSLKGTKTDHVCLINVVSSQTQFDKQDPETTSTDSVERRYNAIYNNKLQIVYIHDDTGCFLDANQAAFDRFEFTREDIGKTYFQDIVHPDDLLLAFEAVQEAMAIGYMKHPIEIRLISKAGELTWVECLGMRLSEEGEPFVGLGIAQDITQRKQAEEALRESETRFREIFANLNDEVVFVDLEGTVVNVNARCWDTFGYTPEETIGHSFKDLDFCGPEEMAKLGEYFLSSVDHGDPIYPSFETALKHKKGHFVPVEINTRPLRNTDGALQGFLSTIRDVTERKRADAELRSSEEKLRDTVNKLRLAQEELSTPVIQIWDHILALPLIGLVDDIRAQQVMDTLLAKIVETQSELVILDVTGVSSMDTEVTNHLMKTIQATSLLGTQCILTGIRPEIAQSLIDLGSDLSDLVIKRDMQEGIKYALGQKGHRVFELHTK